MWAAEQREVPGAVWILAVPAPGFAGECSESSCAVTGEEDTNG